MARRAADLRISLKRRGGQTHRIELVRTMDARRFRVLRDGRVSNKMPEATATEIAAAIRKWLVAELDRPPQDWLDGPA